LIFYWGIWRRVWNIDGLVVTYFDIGISGTSTEVVTDITFEVISTVAHNIIYFLWKDFEPFPSEQYLLEDKNTQLINFNWVF
jgi:hypothetical protein